MDSHNRMSINLKSNFGTSDITDNYSNTVNVGIYSIIFVIGCH